jgi:hypothetical protein
MYPLCRLHEIINFSKKAKIGKKKPKFAKKAKFLKKCQKMPKLGFFGKFWIFWPILDFLEQVAVCHFGGYIKTT